MKNTDFCKCVGEVGCMHIDGKIHCRKCSKVKPADPDWCDCEPSHRSGTFRGKDGCMRCYSCDCKVRDAHPPADVTSGVEATMAISAPEPRVQAEQPLNLADRSFATLSALTVLASNAPPPPETWGDIDTPGEQPDRYASWAIAWATKLIERSELELAKRAMAQTAASKAYGIRPKDKPDAPKQQRLVVNIASLPLVRTGQGDYTIDFFG